MHNINVSISLNTCHHRWLLPVLVGYLWQDDVVKSVSLDFVKTVCEWSSQQRPLLSLIYDKPRLAPERKPLLFPCLLQTPIGCEFSQAVITPLKSCREGKKNFSALRSQYMSERKENKNEKIDDKELDFVNVPFINLQEKGQKGKSSPCFV